MSRHDEAVSDLLRHLLPLGVQHQVVHDHVPERRAAAKPVQEIRNAGPVPTKDAPRTPVKAGEKIGRNSPCPCGSGKKYKNCCGRNAGGN